MHTEQDWVSRNREVRKKHHEADVVVVGAGIFGCGIAYALANQGRSVILLERWMHEPDRIVGELMQPGGVEALRKLGLDKCLEGIDAIPCYGYHVLFHGQDVVIPYPAVDGKGEVKVQGKLGSGKYGHANGSAQTANGAANYEEKPQTRPEGYSFHHGRFIMNLRRACGAHPNISIFETEVTATIRGETSNEVLGVETRTKISKDSSATKSDCFFGQLTIIADGYASKFRKDLLGRAPVVKSKFYALELIDCPFPYPNYGHVIIGKAYPVLMYQIGTHETRALIAVPEGLPAASPANGGVRGYIENVVLPSLPEVVKPSVRAALADGKIPKSMPNSYLPGGRQPRQAGVLILGDAYNMRHPLTGGGMTVAFNDCVLVAELLHPSVLPNLGDGRAIDAAMDQFHWRRKSLTSIINVLAQALYSLFAAADDAQLVVLQRGCFAYFQRGITDEPVGLLGGLIRRPSVLAYHFFSVAFLGIWLHWVDMCTTGWLGPLKLPIALLDAVLILWKACVVFLPVCWQELR